MKNQYLLEACVGSVQSAIEAQKGGANRVELCAALYEGGTTPSAATIQLICNVLTIPVFVIIRPRGGDFLYSDIEFEVMKKDILFAKEMNISGIVIGLLNADGTVDINRTKELVTLASPLNVTFHRAFDMAKDPFKALEDVISTGCTRVLTSGGANKALNGIENLAKLVKQGSGRISIMAGSGVNADNVKQLIQQTGVFEVHSSGKSRIASGMSYKNSAITMGGIPQIPEYDIDITDASSIRSIRNVLDAL